MSLILPNCITFKDIKGSLLGVRTEETDLRSGNMKIEDRIVQEMIVMIDIELSDEEREKETPVFRNGQTITWKKTAEELQKIGPIQVELVSIESWSTLGITKVHSRFACRYSWNPS